MLFNFSCFRSAISIFACLLSPSFASWTCLLFYSALIFVWHPCLSTYPIPFIRPHWNQILIMTYLTRTLVTRSRLFVQRPRLVDIRTYIAIIYLSYSTFTSLGLPFSSHCPSCSDLLLLPSTCHPFLCFVLFTFLHIRSFSLRYLPCLYVILNPILNMLPRQAEFKAHPFFLL